MDKKLPNQADFLEKYNIAIEDFKATKLKWEQLEGIFTDYLKEIPKLEDSAVYIFQRLMKMDGIHSVRYRIKDPEHLIAKIIRKKIEFPARDNVTLENYKAIITDLIGLRALHLFKEDWLPIHNEISAIWDTKEKPVANYRKGDSDEYITWFIENGCEKKEHKFGYRSIHYIIETKPAKHTYYAEVQVRTIFEEAWSEIDHTIRYPYDQSNILFGQFSLILNRLAGSADEMGTFIQALKKESRIKEANYTSNLESYDKEVREKDRIIQELKAKLGHVNLGKEKQNVLETLDKLRPLKLPNSFIESLNKFQSLEPYQSKSIEDFFGISEALKKAMPDFGLNSGTAKNWSAIFHQSLKEPEAPPLNQQIENSSTMSKVTAKSNHGRKSKRDS